MSQVEGATPAGTDPDYGGVQLYTTKDSHRFGRAQVDRIIYGFWQGKLYTITVWTSNFLDFNDLKADAFRRYGKGFQNRVDVEKFYWSDDTTDRLLSYDYNTGFLWMRSREIHERVRARYPD